MRARYSPRAVRDLASIQDYLSARSPIGADNVLAAVCAAVEFVRRNPEAAEATHIPGLRGKLVQKYRFKLSNRVLERGGCNRNRSYPTPLAQALGQEE
jgi:plasmid stabilization system protein ParE